jgi:hypothetical protein
MAGIGILLQQCHLMCAWSNLLYINSYINGIKEIQAIPGENNETI